MLMFVKIGLCQVGTIEGNLYDKIENKGLGFANIWIKKIKKGTTTDTEGNFKIDSVPVGLYEIQASFIGYGDSTITGINVTKDTVIKVQLVLPPACIYDKNIRNKTCPICGKKDKVKPIIYGLPVGKLDEDNYYYAGCLITFCQPHWYCKRDKYKF